MSRWASQIGLSLAAAFLIVVFGAIGLYLLAAGIVFAGAAVLLGLSLYLFWYIWRSRANYHAWR